MTSIRSIVVATDFSPGSKAALERAVQLAGAHGATLHLLHAFDVSAWHSLKGVFDLPSMTMDPPPDVMVQQRLNDVAATLKAQTSLEVVSEFGLGTAERVIEAHVKAHASSLIVIGSRADPVVKGLGSTASKVIRSPECPVLVVREPAARPYSKVLVAVDVGNDAPRAAAFAVALLPTAHHHLLYAVDPGMERALWMGGLAKEHSRSQLDAMHAHASRVLQQLAQDLAGQAQHPVTVEVVDDVPARAVVTRAGALPADCVVVGHHSRGAIAESFLGNMAQHAIHHTSRDVLVVP